LSCMSSVPSPLTRALAARWPRGLLDLLWCAAFAALFAAMLHRSTSDPFSGGSSVELALVEGAQRQGLYKDGRRVGSVVWEARRRPKGWTVRHQFSIQPRSGGEEQSAARSVLRLRRDLSLSGLDLDADLHRLARLSGSAGLLLAGLKEVARIEVRGDCSLETGECHLEGNVGGREVSQSVTAGRGPVVTSAIYPLLARGSLGKKAELRIFDPLSLTQRVVEFRIEGRERLRLHSGTFDTIKVGRDLEGLVTHVWIDKEGRVLKEELPMGLVVEHEAWIKAKGRR